jgi:hypothetical protein
MQGCERKRGVVERMTHLAGESDSGGKKKQTTGSKYATPTKLDTDLDNGHAESTAMKGDKDKTDKTLKGSVTPYDRHILVFGAGSAET